MNIAIQLYSLRDEIEKFGLDEVLKNVKRAGFDGVELAGTYGLDPRCLQEKLAKNGLKAYSAHIALDKLLGNFDEVIELAETLQFKNIVMPYILPEIFNDGFDDFAKQMNAAADIVSAQGFTFLHHNHDLEFENGDGLQRLTDAVERVYLEIDIFWLKAMGYNCAEYLESHKDKIRLLHIKELGADADDYNPIVGKGKDSDSRGAIEFAISNGFSCVILEAEKMAIPYFDYISESCKFIRSCI